MWGKKWGRGSAGGPGAPHGAPQGMRPRPALGTLAVLTSLLPPGIALADEISGLRSDKVFERRHRAEVTMDRAHATVVVRRAAVHRAGHPVQSAVAVGGARGFCAWWLDCMEGAHANAKVGSKHRHSHAPGDGGPGHRSRG